MTLRAPIALLLLSFTSVAGAATTCAEFTALDRQYQNEDAVIVGSPSKGQINLYRETVALTASRQALNPLSREHRAYKYAREDLANRNILGNSLSQVRVDCFNDPQADFEEVTDNAWAFWLDWAATKGGF